MTFAPLPISEIDIVKDEVRKNNVARPIVASPEAEAQLTKIFAFSVGMFVAAVASVTTVAIWIF